MTAIAQQNTEIPNIFNWDYITNKPRQSEGNMTSWGTGTAGRNNARAAQLSPQAQYQTNYVPPVSSRNSSTPVLGQNSTATSRKWDLWEGQTADPASSVASQSPDFWSMKGIFGDENTMGWGGAALGAAQLGMNAWLGMENLGVARDALAFQKSSFTDQFNNQAGITNAELRQRQEWRNRQNPESIPADEYMETARVNLI